MSAGKSITAIVCLILLSKAPLFDENSCISGRRNMGEFSHQFGSVVLRENKRTNTAAKLFRILRRKYYSLAWLLVPSIFILWTHYWFKNKNSWTVYVKASQAPQQRSEETVLSYMCKKPYSLDHYCVACCLARFYKTWLSCKLMAYLQNLVT
jgi:hypothetical protein